MEEPTNPRPQVFVNFRGDELRENFVNHLVRTLRQSGVNAFMDSHERSGRELEQLFTRIEESTIALAIFSKKYPESDWCLNELVKMKNLMKKNKLVVIPIFYNVSAKDVKGKVDPEEDFTINFKKIKNEHANQPELVRKWERAIKSTTKRIGISKKSCGDDFFLVSKIVKEVKRELGMHLETDLSKGGVAFFAFLAYFVFSFIISPLLFPEANFFQTRNWFLCVLVSVVAWTLWD